MQHRNLIKVFALSASVVSLGWLLALWPLILLKWVFCTRCPARWLFLKLPERYGVNEY